MSTVQWIILLIVALIAAVITILVIPRQKRAMPFELVMWAATWVVATLSAWLALGAVDSLAALNGLALFPVAEIPLLPPVLGAFGGALVLTVPLWLMDHFGVNDVTDIEED
jgi:hypothetical protein